MFAKSQTRAYVSHLEENIIEGGEFTVLNDLIKLGIPFPRDFIVTSAALEEFMKENNLFARINNLLKTINFGNTESVIQASNHIKEMIIKGNLPGDLRNEIINDYNKLGAVFKEADCDIYGFFMNSFVSHQERLFITGIKGKDKLLERIKEAWSYFLVSAFIHKRHAKTNVNLLVKESVKPDISGTAVTVDPVAKEKFKILKISTGELNEGMFDILRSLLKKMNEYFYFPMKVDWAIKNNKLYITSIKPSPLEKIARKTAYTSLLKGKNIGIKIIVTGPARIVKSRKEANKIIPGDILVFPRADENSLFPPEITAPVILGKNKFFKNSQLLNLRFAQAPVILTDIDPSTVLKNGVIVTIHGLKEEVYQGGLWQR